MDADKVRLWLDKAEDQANDEIFCCEDFTPEVEKLIAVARSALKCRTTELKGLRAWFEESCAVDELDAALAALVETEK